MCSIFSFLKGYGYIIPEVGKLIHGRKQILSFFSKNFRDVNDMLVIINILQKFAANLREIFAKETASFKMVVTVGWLPQHATFRRPGPGSNI